MKQHAFACYITMGMLTNPKVKETKAQVSVSSQVYT